MSDRTQAIDWSRFVDNTSALDLLKNSIGKSIDYNFYANRTNFKVVALSPSIPLSAVESAALPGGSKTDDRPVIGKYIIKGRIIDENSPHSWIPDPCRLDKGDDAQEALDLVMAHTTFIVYGDPKAAMRAPIKPGDVFLAEMTPLKHSYDLQYGRFLDVLERGGLAQYRMRSSPEMACQSLAKHFPVFPEFADGLGEGPKEATYTGIAGSNIPITNGNLPGHILGQADTTYSNGATMLIDLVDSFNAFAKLHYEFTGTVAGGGVPRKIQVNSAYRSYEEAKTICGGIDPATGRCKNKLSSLPGTSRHGWASAVDWQLTIGWGDKSVKDRKKQFNCPVWQHLWLNSHTVADTNGVYWTSPAWARPKTGVGSATDSDTLGEFAGFEGKGENMIEAWHWEPTNFSKLITGIG